MVYQVTEEQKRALENDGIVKLPGVIDSALLEELNACFAWSVEHPGPIAVGSTEGEDFLFVENANPEARPMYEDLVKRSGFPQIAADLWGSEYVGYLAEEVFWKKGKTMQTFWHQDTIYSPWGGEQWCNFWMPLVAMDADHSIQVVRGSHKGIQYDGTTFNPKDPTEPLWGDAGNFPRLPDITAEVKVDPDAWDIIGYAVEPGDIVVLHPHCLHHGGGTDDSLPERRNMVVRFFGEKSYYSDHLPDAKGMYEHKPIASVTGGYLEYGDPYRPAVSPNLIG